MKPRGGVQKAASENPEKTSNLTDRARVISDTCKAEVYPFCREKTLQGGQKLIAVLNAHERFKAGEGEAVPREQLLEAARFFEELAKKNEGHQNKRVGTIAANFCDELVAQCIKENPDADLDQLAA